MDGRKHGRIIGQNPFYIPHVFLTNILHSIVYKILKLDALINDFTLLETCYYQQTN